MRFYTDKNYKKIFVLHSKKMLKGFLLNGDLLKCNERTCKPELPKTHVGQKKTGIPECEQENKLLEKLKKVSFDEAGSISYNWLKQMFGENNIRYEKVRGICEILAFLLNEKLTREIYRRRISCIYWMEQNLNEIAETLRANTLIALSEGKVVHFSPPDIGSKIKNNETSVIADKSVECFDVFLDEDDKAQIFADEQWGEFVDF